MTLTDLLRPWLKERYADQVWIDRGEGWNGDFIRGHCPNRVDRSWPMTFAVIHNDTPAFIRTYRSVRSKHRQRDEDGRYVYNFTPVYKALQPSNPDFLEHLKHELDLMKAQGW